MEMHDIFLLIFVSICGLFLLAYSGYSCHKYFSKDTFSGPFIEIGQRGPSWPKSYYFCLICRALQNDKRSWVCRPTKMPLVNDSGFPIRPYQFSEGRTERGIPSKKQPTAKITRTQNKEDEVSFEKEKLLPRRGSNDSYGTMEFTSSPRHHWFDSFSSSGTYSSTSGAYSQSSTCLADDSSNSIVTVALVFDSSSDEGSPQQGQDEIIIPLLPEGDLSALMQEGKLTCSTSGDEV